MYKIFQDRCGQDLRITFQYKDTEKSKYLENSNKVIDNLVHSIVKRYEEASSANEFMNEDDGTEEKKQKADHRARPKKENSGFDKNVKVKNPYEKSEGPRSSSLKRSSNPDVFYGRDIDGDPMPIEQIQGEMGDVIIRGKILDFEDKEFQEGAKSILMFNITDETDTIQVKIFVRREQKEDIVPNLAPGNFIKVHGVAAMDNYSHEVAISSVRGMMKIQDFIEKRMDLAAEKRVELHCHTKMSDI